MSKRVVMAMTPKGVDYQFSINSVDIDNLKSYAKKHGLKTLDQLFRMKKKPKGKRC